MYSVCIIHGASSGTHLSLPRVNPLLIPPEWFVCECVASFINVIPVIFGPHASEKVKKGR